MPTIHLTTFIAAPVNVVFDLSRHIGMHKAKHLFKTRLLRVKISEMIKPQMFIDEQIQGDFREMKHEHHFKPCENGTILIDLFHYESPYGVVGQWFNSLYLTRYMRRLLEQRNKAIKEFAESDKWKKLLIK